MDELASPAGQALVSAALGHPLLEMFVQVPR
jgi:hypothetical protein